MLLSMKQNALFSYFRESFQELNKVSWPTKNQAVRITAIVLIFSLVVAVFIALLDYLFTFLFQLIVNRIGS